RCADSRSRGRDGQRSRRLFRARGAELRAWTGVAAPCSEPCAGLWLPRQLEPSGWECLRFRSSAIALHRVVLAQGMSLPVFGHEDAAKIRVSFEAYAKKVEDFAFVIVGARPD